jgi:hypothetical protein
MKKHVYLITMAAAALLAGTLYAGAQGTPKPAPAGAEQGTPGQGQLQDNQQQQPKKEQSRPGQRQGDVQGQQRELKTQGQSEQRQSAPTPAQRPQEEKTQQTQQGQPSQPGPGKQDVQQKTGGSATFTTEQRTQIRTTVLQGSNAPRATNVNFSINVGTVVPKNVRIVGVPRVILDVHPNWRGYSYFVVNDQIIIVDRNHKIVAVLDV